VRAFGIGTLNTLRAWLSTWSLRTSQCVAVPHLARITQPALVVHATADACVYESDARALYDSLASADKQLEMIKADHYLLEPAGARTQAADLIAAWVAARQKPGQSGPTIRATPSSIAKCVLDCHASPK
jgi:alpha-beta hydrolase superfamily lysophospholipase